MTDDKDKLRDEVAILRHKREQRFQSLESRCHNLELALEKTQRHIILLNGILFDLLQERAYAKASLCEVPEILSAKEERVRMDRNETLRWRTGTARNGSS